MSRVAFFASNMPVGGVPRMLTQITADLAERGLDVDLVLIHKVGAFLEQVSPKVRIVDLGSPPFWSVPLALAHYLRREKPDSMLATDLHRNIYALVASILSGRKTRIVLSTRIMTSCYASDFHTPWQQWVMRAGYRCLAIPLFPFAARIHAVSEDAARDLERFAFLPHGKVEVVYNPFISKQLQEKAAQPLDHPWFAPGEPPVILSVGRLHPQKDFATLIRAFAIVRKTTSARLLILAEGSERPFLESLISELGIADDVSLPGFAANPFAYMSRCAVFVLSSLYEGCPNVLVEALGCGAPVVSTRCPGGPVEILKEAVYGPLVPVGDEHAMAQALLACLHDHDAAKKRTDAFLTERSVMFTREASVNGYYRLLMEA